MGSTLLFLVFVSPEYVEGDTDWCAREVGRYISRARWPDDPSKTGIFIIEAGETDRAAWPNELKDSRGFAQIAQVLHKRPGG